MRIYIGLVSVFPKVHCPRRVIRLSFVEQQGFASSESCKTVSFADIAGTQESVDPIPAWVYDSDDSAGAWSSGAGHGAIQCTATDTCQSVPQ